LRTGIFIKYFIKKVTEIEK